MALIRRGHGFWCRGSDCIVRNQAAPRPRFSLHKGSLPKGLGCMFGFKIATRVISEKARQKGPRSSATKEYADGDLDMLVQRTASEIVETLKQHHATGQTIEGKLHRFLLCTARCCLGFKTGRLRKVQNAK